MGGRGLGGCLSTLLVWLDNFCHAPQWRLGPLGRRGSCLSSEALRARLGEGVLGLPAAAAFMKDGDGNVARAELGVHGVALPRGQQPGTLPGWAIGRGQGLLG